ncbi:DUF7937 domain-containing protein [Krasilnikoviella flava]|uniref:Uncharacterized protein n=1 Tax=Krasilnikoviella flava TaxID=526729 RepID=A0A1T5KXC1_9MICO|nr:hypothetical protein [Krasilnikoviella flava]SKC68377.1 hypothetical protein SAMN04324258_2556 [Krasilnikoviella flava]
MTDPDTLDAPEQERSPFGGVAVRELVRDVVAAFALLVALPLPWDHAHRGSDRLEIVLVTVLALLALAAPYLRRGGVGPSSWDVLTSRRTVAFACLPYAVVAVVYLVLDALAPADAAGGVGAGLAVGLAGAALAAAPRWTHTPAAVAGIVALGTLATPVAALVQGAPWAVTVVGTLNALVVLGVLWFTVGTYLRSGDLSAGYVLLALGGAVALELVLFAGGNLRPWFESVHGQRLGLLLLPVVAAVTARRVVDDATAAAGDPDDVRAARWVAVAVRAFGLVALVAAFVALVALVLVVADGVSVGRVLRLVVGVLMAGVAVAARRSLARDPRAGHVTAVGAACVIVVLGLVIVVARAGLGTQSNVEELLVAFGLPAVALAVLLVPPSVRELVASAPESPEPVAAAPVTEVAEPATGAVQVSAPAGSADETPAERTTPEAERASWSVAAPVATEPQAAPRTAARPLDATQQMEPVRVTQAPDSTQVLPPVREAPPAQAPGWTAAQAMDPSTPLADLARISAEAPHLRSYVAANPSTYPALLDWLGALGDPAVDAALRSRR